jgi:hypothetical protein
LLAAAYLTGSILSSRGWRRKRRVYSAHRPPSDLMSREGGIRQFIEQEHSWNRVENDVIAMMMSIQVSVSEIATSKFPSM